MVGGPSQIDTCDYKPKMRRDVRQGPARLRPRQPAPDHHDLRPEALPGRARRLQVRPARPERDVGERALALDREDGGRARLRPVAAHRGDQPRAGHHAIRPATRSRAGRASGPGSPTASGPSTRTCRRSSSSSTNTNSRTGAGDLRPAVGSRLPPGRACRRLRPRRRATRSCTSTTPPASTGRRRRKTLDGLQALNETARRRRSATPRRRRASQQYEMAFRMQASVPELTDVSGGAGIRPRALRRRSAQAGHVRRELPPGASDGRARRPLRADLPQRLGHAHEPPAPASPAVPTTWIRHATA